MRELGARRAADRGRYIDIDIDRAAASRYGLNIADVRSVIAPAVGGETIGETVEGLARIPISAATAAELLFALDEPALAEQLIIDRAAELDGRSYELLTSLVEAAKAKGRLVAATLVWRALLDAIRARAYAKAYGHAARYLQGLRAVAPDIRDYRGHPTHEMCEQSLRRAHGRKTSFWARLVDE
jgi:hypothetical protein